MQVCRTSRSYGRWRLRPRAIGSFLVRAAAPALRGRAVALGPQPSLLRASCRFGAFTALRGSECQQDQLPDLGQAVVAVAFLVPETLRSDDQLASRREARSLLR